MTAGTTSLQKSLSRFDATMIVMGTIIGVGIFFQPRQTASDTGSAGWSMLAWAVGSVLALTGAFTYAALGKLVPETGGPYVYLRRAFGPLAGFLYGWMILVGIGSGATAVVGLIFVDHLARFLHLDLEAADAPERAFALRSTIAAATIVVLAVINVLGVRWGSRVQNVFTVLKILALAALIAAGVARGGQPIAFATAEGHAPDSTALGFLGAMAGVLFSFGGWQNLSNVAGEMRSPQKDLVPAIVQGVIGVAILYLLANFAFLRLLTVPELIASQTPAADALERAIGSRAGDAAALLIVISAFGIVNGLMLSLPRIYYAMARDGMLSSPFGRASPRFRTPALAIATQGAFAAAFCFVESVGALTDYVAFADWFFFSLNAVALFVIVRQHGASRRDVGLGYPVVPAIFALLATTATIGMLIANWENARFGLLFLLGGAAIYALFLLDRVRPAAQSN